MKEIWRSIGKKEYKFLALITLVTAILIMLPAVWGFLAAGAQGTFSGIGSLTPGDNPVYYSYINQVKNGQFLIYDLFTGERQTYGMFNVFWYLAGQFARVFELSPILAFHLLRLMLLPFFIWAAYLFIANFLVEKNLRRLALYFVLFAGGIGAYVIGPLSVLVDLSAKKGYWTPNDLWIPESLAFLTLSKTPHFIASWVFMMLILLLIFLAINKNRPACYVSAGLMALVYFNFHPFYIPMIFLVAGIYLLYEIFRAGKILWQKCFWFCVFVLLSSPSIFYHSWLLANEPSLRLRAFQNITLAPPFIFILAGYGFLWFFGLWGIWALFKKKELKDKYAFLLIWLVVCLILILAPWQFQSRNTQGLQLPLAIFSVFGLLAFRQWLAAKGLEKKFKYLIADKFLLAVLFLVVFGSAPAFNILRDVYYYTFKPEPVGDYFYLKNDNLGAIEILNNVAVDRVVLAHPLNALFISGLTLNRSYYAHVIETTFFKSKLQYLTWFFRSNGQDEKKYQFLKKNDIDYIFFTPLEAELGDFQPGQKEYLKEIFSLNEARIYQVIY